MAGLDTQENPENSGNQTANSAPNGSCDKESNPVSIERSIPNINAEERIIFMIDLCSEEENTLFTVSEGSYSFLQMIKRVLPIFVYNKTIINPRHKFALVALLDRPVWLTDFTSDPDKIIKDLESLKDVPSPSNLDLSGIFDIINEHITFPVTSTENSVDVSFAVPDYIVRAVLVYGRSLCIPQFLSGKESFQELVQKRFFFFDVIYVHETPSDDNKCEGIFELLCNLDERGWSYIFEVGRNATKFHNLFGALLAHPLQRPLQKDSNYVLTKV